MNRNDELTKELAKNEADKYVIKKELEKSKNEFINYLNDIGAEIKHFDFQNENKPIIYNKPFKVKVKSFFNKLGKVLGF